MSIRFYFFKTLPAFLFLVSACAPQKDSIDEATAKQVHLVFHPTYSMPLPDESSISEIAVRRVDCEFQDQGVEHVLPVVQSEGVFVFNIPENELRECGILVRRIVLKSKTGNVDFNLVKQVRSEKGSRELLLAPAEGNMGINITLPEKNPLRVETNLNWPLNIAYNEYKDGRYPLVGSATDPLAKSLKLRLASVEDRGIVSSSWREYGITLICDVWAKFLECGDRSLLRVLARFVREQDVSPENAAQVRQALGQTQLQFESTLSHFIGSGLRFTLLFPLSWQGQSLLLLVGNDQAHNVFKIDQNLVSTANQ